MELKLIELPFALPICTLPTTFLQAYKRRGESFKKMIGFPGMQNAMQMFLPPFSSPYSNIIHDYIESCWLQDHPDPKVFYEALMMAVDEGQ